MLCALHQTLFAYKSACPHIFRFCYYILICIILQLKLNRLASSLRHRKQIHKSFAAYIHSIYTLRTLYIFFLALISKKNMFASYRLFYTPPSYALIFYFLLSYFSYSYFTRKSTIYALSARGCQITNLLSSILIYYKVSQRARSERL